MATATAPTAGTGELAGQEDGPERPDAPRDLSGRAGLNRAHRESRANGGLGPAAGTDAQDDREAIARWIAARSGSPETRWADHEPHRTYATGRPILNAG